MSITRARNNNEFVLPKTYEAIRQFSAVIQEDTIEELYTKVKNVIWAQSGPSIWIPSKENL